MLDLQILICGGNYLRYILLLRGINVGGKNKVSMSNFKELLKNSGVKNVTSSINSGNLLFDSDEDQESCVSNIRYLLETNYDFSIPFALLTKEEYLKEREKLPDWWNEDLARRDILFFSSDLDKTSVLDFLDKIVFYNEIVYVGKCAVFWGKYNESEYLKTSYHKKLMKQDFYKKITIRNGNTFESFLYTINRSRD